MTFKKYKNRETGEIVEMKLTPTGKVKYWFVGSKNRPSVISAQNFDQQFEEVKENE